MSFRKIVFAAGFLAVAGFTFNFGVHDAKALTSAEIQALIVQLQQQIADLQKQLKATEEQPAAWCHTFNTNLKYGDSGSEILALQTALGKEGFHVMDIEENGQGNNFFGEFTSSAVVGFQEKYKSEILAPYGLKNGTGFAGISTRAKLNKLYGCGVSTAPVTVISPNGGEKWVFGTPQTIKWSTGQIGTTKWGTGSGKTFALGLQATNGLICSIGKVNALDWTTTVTLQENQECPGNPYFPKLIAGQYKLFIDAAAATGVENEGDTSDNYFSIAAATAAQTGSLSLELAADNPIAQSVVALSKDVSFLKVKFTAGAAEDIHITSLKVYTYGDGGVYSARATDVSNLALYDGNTRLTTKKQVSSNGWVAFSSNEFIHTDGLLIPKDTSKTITVKADIPSTAAATALQLALSGGNDLIAAGVTSGASVTAINSAMGNVMSIVSSGNITLSSASVPSVYLSAGEKEIFRFNLSVSSVEDIAVNYLKFSVKKQESSGSSITGAQLADISNFKLYNLTKNISVASAEIAEGEVIFRNITTIVDRGTTQVFALKGNVLKTNLCSLTTELLTLTAQGVTTAKVISPAGSTAAANLQGTCATQPSITVLSPNGGEVFQQGKNNTISWKGGKNKVQIGIVKSSFDPAKDGVLGWIFTSALPDKTGTWDANSVSDLSLTTVWNVLSLYPGPFKIIAVSESASGNYCFGAQGVSISSDCNFDYSDNYFTIAAATPADCSYLSSGVLGAYLQGCGSAKYNPVFDFNKDKIINASDFSEITVKLNDAAWCAAKKTETTSPCSASGTLNDIESQLAAISSIISGLLKAVR